MPGVVFVHIPKAGGMSFGPIVVRQFPKAAVLGADAPDIAAFEARWSALCEHRRQQIRCIHGHVPFGVHAFLAERAVYVTLLREPVDRLVSAYYYALRRPEIAAHRTLVTGGITLHEYITSDLSADVHDAQTKALAGGAAGPGALGRALRNLDEHFAVVGLSERFDETALVCRRLLGWGNVLYVERNRNRRRARLADVAPVTVEAIRVRNPLDHELYSRAAHRFAGILRAHPISAVELGAFRRHNRVYGLARRFLELPAALVRDARAASSRRRWAS